MRLSSILLLFLPLLFVIEAEASTLSKVAKVPKGGLIGSALNLGVTGGLLAYDWLMTEGVKVKRTTSDTPTDITDLQSGAGTIPASKPVPPNASYPIEYCIDGKCFDSYQAAKDYVTSSSFLAKRGLKIMRTRDGLYYKKIDVVFNDGTIYGTSNSTLGFFQVFVNVGYLGDSDPYNVGGWVEVYIGSIYYRGEEDIESVTLDEKYKAKREAAKKALTEALTSALPIDDDIEDQPLPGDVEIPDIKSKPKAPVVPIPKDEPANDPEYNPKDKDKKTDKPKPVLPIHPQETPNPKTNPKTEPTTQPDPKPVVPIHPHETPDPNNDPQKAPNNDPKPNTKPQPKPDPNTKPDPKLDPKSDPQKAPNNDPKPNVESQPKPGSNNDPKPNQDDKQSPNFELPAFCDWATWFCKDDTKPDDNTKVEVKEPDFDYEAIARRPYIVLPKTCPANPTFSFDMPFVAQKLSLDFPLHLFCQAFAMFKIVVILFGYIKALSIIGQSD